MATVQEKYDLVRETAEVLVKQEFRSSSLRDYRPKVSLVIYKDNKEDSGYEFTNTRILLEYPESYPEGRWVRPDNWFGMGDDVDDALGGNLLTFEYELEERIAELQVVLEKVKEALPDKFKKEK